MKVLAAQLNPIIGDLTHNTTKILETIDHAKEHNIDLLIFPELALTGYPPEDFLLLPHFIEAVEEQLQKVVDASAGIHLIIGTIRKNPSEKTKRLFNSAAIIHNKKLCGYHDKQLLPTYDVFDEHRYFEPGQEAKLWSIAGKKVAITICEDLWQESGQLTYSDYAVNPIEELKATPPDLVINISASPFSKNKAEIREKVCQQTSKTLGAPLILCNQVGGNDSLIFDGNSLYLDAKAVLQKKAKAFEEDLLFIDMDAPLEKVSFPKQDPSEKLYRALVLGLRDYFHKSHFHKACFGLSGGIDSALVAAIATEALGKENLLAVAMPSRYSSDHSLTDAKELTNNLAIPLRIIPIEKPFQSYLDLLSPHFEDRPHDSTEENLQARIRGMLLMAFSNKLGYIVLSTGNKSEMAMGYATLYGDMCGGLGVINDLTKGEVYALCEWINREKLVIPQNILEKAPSAELRPNQKDSDSLPDYSIIDTLVEDYLVDHLSPEAIAKKRKIELPLVEELIRKIHQNEYKRRQSPPGLRVTERAFTKGYHFPIVQGWVG